MTKERAKNLSDGEINQITAILDGWSGRLQWELLIEAIDRRGLGRYTRQALYRHDRVYKAFNDCKDRLSEQIGDGTITHARPEMQVALQTKARLEGENARLYAENNRLLERFVRWAYNARKRGLDEDYLNQPLPEIDREPSKLPRAAAKRPATRAAKAPAKPKPSRRGGA